MSLLGILEHKIDTGVIIPPQEVFGVCWCYVFYINFIFLSTGSCHYI